VAFVVRNEKGNIDKRKTSALMKQLEKSCKNINKSVLKEVTAFKEMAVSAGVEDSFWRAAAHRAMLTLHQNNMDVWLSAEFGDLFGNVDLHDPETINSWLDVERLEKARSKWEEKQAKKLKS
tara:strand:- start:408 stop:773 length:366 start_codon:yes stop_codon:yes gene_type:complete